MNLIQRKNKKGDKITFYYDFGRGAGQRPSTGVFIYAKPKTPIEKAHNKEALVLLEVKKSETIIEQQAIGSAYIPKHKFKENFFDYYEEYVKLYKKGNNRHLNACLSKLKVFVGKDFLAPISITENFCKSFRNYLLEKLNGESPANYFARFKWVIAAATSDGYFRGNPSEKVAAKCNPSVNLKNNLEVEEYIELINTPCFNEQVKLSFIFCCYTGLRWVDVEPLQWPDLSGNKLTTRIIQRKTGFPVVLTLHPIALAIIQQRENTVPEERRNGKVFQLPTQDGANKVLKEWIAKSKINKHITWSCARLSFSILLQDQNVDEATVACLLGHTTTKQVSRTYRRHRPKNQKETIALLPSVEQLPYFLKSDS